MWHRSVDYYPYRAALVSAYDINIVLTSLFVHRVGVPYRHGEVVVPVHELCQLASLLARYRIRCTYYSNKRRLTGVIIDVR